MLLVTCISVTVWLCPLAVIRTVTGGNDRDVNTALQVLTDLTNI